MKKILFTVLLALLVLWGCGTKEESAGSTPNTDFKEKVAAKFGLTLFELDNGIGPIKEKINLTNQIDQIMAKSGEDVFVQKCAQCHKLDERYTGPALRGVTERRSPEYIMNMILNPEEMTKRHPEAKKMLAQYANQMTFQNVTEDDARNLLEYLRSVNQ
ncbi:MAG: cytochrome c [Melioribacteraceae bacterium]|nr:cytochrome c [Melioribacteraceae bacterium]MCF8354963.1 cytochrome c [Melioribacteraceae bacterium]MCF8394020.1 cytochrome c [Melioribacteraceae bacterium]MCF8419777.1 cytochrome c [Melioribacteraceae bacterium]